MENSIIALVNSQLEPLSSQIEKNQPRDGFLIWTFLLFVFFGEIIFSIFAVIKTFDYQMNQPKKYVSLQNPSSNLEVLGTSIGPNVDCEALKRENIKMTVQDCADLYSLWGKTPPPQH